MTKRAKAGVLFVAIVAALGAALLFERGPGERAAVPSAVASNSAASASEPPPPSRVLKADNPCTRERCAPCPTDKRPEIVPGECCPRCVSADQTACERGRDRYQHSYTELEAELRACTTDDDCMVASFGDACRASCPLPLNKQALGAVVPKLRQAASVRCKDCAPQQFECPRIATDSAQCVGGRCEFRQQAQPTAL